MGADWSSGAPDWGVASSAGWLSLAAGVFAAVGCCTLEGRCALDGLCGMLANRSWALAGRWSRARDDADVCSAGAELGREGTARRAGVQAVQVDFALGVSQGKVWLKVDMRMPGDRPS
eukprot:1950736-Prymnesium_polylepis.1